jgi:hypothetical protein
MGHGCVCMPLVVDRILRIAMLHTRNTKMNPWMNVLTLIMFFLFMWWAVEKGLPNFFSIAYQGWRTGLEFLIAVGLLGIVTAVFIYFYTGL